jgi:hypothetical protein
VKPLPQPLTLEEARSIFDYDPSTGSIIRKKGYIRSPGKPAGCVHHTGYLVVKVGNKPVLAQRLVWFLFYGEWPGNLCIDHINHDKLDNRICNLRKATHGENRVNSKKHSNKTGFKGVQFNPKAKTGKKWFATISDHGREKYLGSHHTAEEAAMAFRKAAIEIHGEFAESAQ